MIIQNSEDTYNSVSRLSLLESVSPSSPPSSFFPAPIVIPRPVWVVSPAPEKFLFLRLPVEFIEYLLQLHFSWQSG